MSQTVSNTSQMKVFSTSDLLGHILSFSGDELSASKTCRALRNGVGRAISRAWGNFPIERFSFVQRVIQAPHERPTNVAELYLLFQRFSRLTAKFRPTNRIPVHSLTFSPSRICAAWQRVFQEESDWCLMRIMPVITNQLDLIVPPNANAAREFLRLHKDAIENIGFLHVIGIFYLITMIPEEVKLNFRNLSVYYDDYDRRFFEEGFCWEDIEAPSWETLSEYQENVNEAAADDAEDDSESPENLHQAAVVNGAVKSSQA